jgi:demethylmenaquinone methyltransferase/2-methoxy-6-polyprenyl-1,4-benzoquinol methylase
MSFVYMKVLETVPARYDRGMRLLTAGRWATMHRDIVTFLVNRVGIAPTPGSPSTPAGAATCVLDLGCGTGALAIALAETGFRVTGIDVSESMLDVARRRVLEAGVEPLVSLRRLGAVDLDDAFSDSCLDAICSTLVFSELSGDEIAYTLTECDRILRPGGLLLVADEVKADSMLGRIAGALIRLPLAVLAFLLTQSTTRRVSRLGDRIERGGFRIVDRREYLAGTLVLYCAEKAV